MMNLLQIFRTSLFLFLKSLFYLLLFDFSLLDFFHLFRVLLLDDLLFRNIQNTLISLLFLLLLLKFAAVFTVRK